MQRIRLKTTRRFHRLTRAAVDARVQAEVARQFRIENKHVFTKKIPKQSRRVSEGYTCSGDKISEIRAAVMREKFTRPTECLEFKRWKLDIVYSINFGIVRASEHDG